MSRERQTSDTSQTKERTPEQERLDALDLELRESGQSGLSELQDLGQQLSAGLLQGGDLPGAFGDNIFGLSEEDITGISQKAVSDIQPEFQKSGILDSGVAAAISGQVAGESRLNSAQFNVGALHNALNIAFGGQAQTQASTLGVGESLGNRLSQFGTTTTSGTTTSPNPFLQSFQQSLGQTLGAPKVSAGPFTFGGS